MTTNQITAGCISLILLASLGWTIVGGVGDRRTQIMLGVGATLGLVYTVYGRVPDWIINRSGRFLTEDDDPANISPRVYLPVLFTVVVVAVLLFVIVVFVL